MLSLKFCLAQGSIWFRVFAVWDKVQVFEVGTYLEWFAGKLPCDLEASPQQEETACAHRFAYGHDSIVITSMKLSVSAWPITLTFYRIK